MSDGGFLAFAGREHGIHHFKRADAFAGGDRVRELVERPLLGGQHHGFHVAQRDPLFFSDVQNEFLQLTRNHHHVAAERIDEFAPGVRIDLGLARAAVFLNPADSVTLFHAAQFHNCRIASHRFADALVALLVGHVHTADIDRDADVVGDKNHHGVRIRIFCVILDGFELVFVRTAPKQRFHAANKEDLKRRHQRRRSRPVQYLGEIGLSEVQLVKAELAEIVRHQGLQNCVAALPAEKRLVADEDVHRAQLAGLHLGNESLGLRKRPHQKASRTLETRVRAKSRDRR